uniref:Copia protein n=1 Tax=Tanacetum cinerariifolium TaxID=118510 RepID=A0A6L2N0M5_TANCI|nr:copia protein [Tanacetum cinerariifolium]
MASTRADEIHNIIVGDIPCASAVGDPDHGHKQEEGIDYDEVFAPVAWIEAIKLFLAYALFMDFTVYQMDVKSAFLYGTIEEEVYVSQHLGFVDPEFPDKVYKVEKALCGLYQAPRACKYSNGDTQPLSKDATGTDVDVHLYSDYAGASLDRKSTTGGCQFLGSRLIFWQCKKQTIVANSTTEAKYILLPTTVDRSFSISKGSCSLGGLSKSIPSSALVVERSLSMDSKEEIALELLWLW